MTAAANPIPKPSSPGMPVNQSDRSGHLQIAHYLRVLDLSEGGVVRCVLDLSAVLAKAGHAVTLFTCDPRDAPHDWTRENPATPTVVTLDGPGHASMGFTSAQLPQLTKLLKDIDVLHLHALWQRANPQWAKAARSLGIPYILSTHGMLDVWPMSQGRIKKRIYHTLVGKRLLKDAAAVHCTAQGELDQACRWFPKNLGRVVPLVFDLQPFTPGPGPQLARESLPGFDRGDPIILFLSRLHLKKGVEHLLNAAAILKRRGVDATFLVAGTGEESYTASLRTMAKDLGVADSVCFLGMISGEMKFSLLQAADISLLPTSQENFGFAIVEAMAGGSPVITTKGVDIWPELERSGGAILTPQQPEPIADAIEKLLGDSEKCQAMGDAAKKWTLETFSGNTIVEQYEKLYRACIARVGGKS